MILFRVKNLSKTNDKRLTYFPTSTPLRRRGVWGKKVSVEKLLGSYFRDLYRLDGLNGEVLGVYRREELEPVTLDQMVLEAVVEQLLTIFPNQVPSVVLCPNTADLKDFLTVERMLPVLRKYLAATDIK